MADEQADQDGPQDRPKGRGNGKGIKANETARNAAKLVLEGGGTQAMAAQAAGVSPTAVSRWVEQWEAEGWRRPFSAAAARTEVARDVALGRWVDHRERVGVRAGLVAERILGRILQLVPAAGESETVIEQALDPVTGQPTGIPRHRVLTKVPSAEVQRLADAVARLWVVADKSAGLDNGIDISVTNRSESVVFAETTDDRMRRVLDVFEAVASEEQHGHNGQNGHR